mgnify:CR=1 FL=1
MDDLDKVAAEIIGCSVMQTEGEPVPGLNTEDWLYEVGRGWVAPGFDAELLGASAGDDLTFVATPNGTEEPADMTVTATRTR